MDIGLEQVYYVSQTVSSVAVICSLFYLAVQVRDQNRESRRRAVSELTTNLGNWQSTIAADEKLVELWLKGIEHYATLEPVEKTRFALLFNHGFRITESLYLDYLDGRVSGDMFDTYAATLDRMVPLPGVQAWWEDRGWWFQAPFRALMDGKIAHARATGGFSDAWPAWNSGDEKS